MQEITLSPDFYTGLGPDAIPGPPSWYSRARCLAADDALLFPERGRVGFVPPRCRR